VIHPHLDKNQAKATTTKSIHYLEVENCSFYYWLYCVLHFVIVILSLSARVWTTFFIFEALWKIFQCLHVLQYPKTSCTIYIPVQYAVASRCLCEFRKNDSIDIGWYIIVFSLFIDFLSLSFYSFVTYISNRGRHILYVYYNLYCTRKLE